MALKASHHPTNPENIPAQTSQVPLGGEPHHSARVNEEKTGRTGGLAHLQKGWHVSPLRIKKTFYKSSFKLFLVEMSGLVFDSPL